jgi:magnesium chelatase family protein
VSVPATRAGALVGRQPGESSAVMRERVVRARERQLRRYEGLGVYCNAQLGPKATREHCGLDEGGAALLETAIRNLGLSGRAYHRILRVARTVADLDGAAAVDPDHVAEAVQFRTLDRPVVAEEPIRA